MNNPFLKIDNLSKNYGETQALSEISLSLHAEELLVVLGPTGAGKTTLLRLIAGLETADTGRITVNGADITHQLPAERDIALVFQNFSLYPNKTVRQNLAFPLQAPGRNLSKTDIENRISHTADLLRITPLLDRPATHLSGGEMQRVAIGRAIVRQPQLFLLDEPLTNLDAKLREVLRVELIRLQRDLRTPMIYVTHDRVEALSMGDRIAVLSDGKILQIGSPEDIYQQPNSPTVARQLGYPPINTIDVHKQARSMVHRLESPPPCRRPQRPFKRHPRHPCGKYFPPWRRNPRGHPSRRRPRRIDHLARRLGGTTHPDFDIRRATVARRG